MLLSPTQCFMANCVLHRMLAFPASATWCYSVGISELQYPLVAQNYVRRGTLLPLKIKTASSGNLRAFACWWKDAVQAAWVCSVPCLGNPSCCSALCFLLAVFPSAAPVGGCTGTEIKHWAGRAQLCAAVTVSPSLNRPTSWTSSTSLMSSLSSWATAFTAVPLWFLSPEQTALMSYLHWVQVWGRCTAYRLSCP